MSQQINLLVRQDGKQASIAKPALIGLGALLAVMLGFWAIEHSSTVKIQKAADQGKQQLLAAKAELQAKQQQLATGETYAGENAALKQRMETLQGALNLVKGGNPGRPEGYSEYLTALAKISDNSLWLNSVAISSAGKKIHLAGRALTKESILRYAKRLNEQFSAYGVQFNSVEMTPEVLGKEGVDQLSIVVFKLY